MIKSQYLVTAHSWIISTMAPTYAKPLEKKFARKVHTLLIEHDGYCEEVKEIAIKLLNQRVDDFCEFLPEKIAKRRKPLRNRIMGEFKRINNHLMSNPTEDNIRDRAVRFDIGLILSLPVDGVYELQSQNTELVNDKDYKTDGVLRIALNDLAHEQVAV